MTLLINGKPQSFKQQLSINKLLKELKIDGQSVAVAVNKMCITRSSFARHLLKENDHVEILSPMAGG